MFEFLRRANCSSRLTPTRVASVFVLYTFLPGCDSSKGITATARQLEDVQAALRSLEQEVIGLRQDNFREKDGSASAQQIADIHALLKRFEGQWDSWRQLGIRETDRNVFVKQLEAIEKSLKRVEDELISPRGSIPPETMQKLDDLENRLNAPGKWPKDINEAETMRQQLDALVQNLSPLSAERALPRLARLNWGIEALWNLQNHKNATPEQLEPVQAIIEEMLERDSSGNFPKIQNALKTRLKEIESQLREFQIRQLRERAERALKGIEDPEATLNSLKNFEQEKEVAEIIPKLRNKVLEKMGLERIKALKGNLNRVRSFSDTRMRQVALLNIQDGLLQLIVDLELQNVVPEFVVTEAKNVLSLCDKELNILVAKQQEEGAERLRRYQSWALEQIRKFDGPDGWYYDVTLPWVENELKNFKDAAQNKEWVALREFPSLKDLIQEKLGVDMSEIKGAMLTAKKRREIYSAASSTIGWKKDIHREIAYRTTRDGMVKYLLPIQLQLLDPPVAQLYQQAFSKGWQKLEGRDDQLFVAQQSAVVRKKTVEEITTSNK